MTGKPPSTSEMMCPQFRKPLRKVCHLCEWYHPMHVTPVDDRSPGPQSSDVWGCNQNHQMVLLADIIRRLGGVQQATESFRNTAWKDAQQTLHDVIEVVKHGGTFNRSLAEKVANVLAAIEDRPPALPPGDGAKLLNGTPS